MAGVEGFEPPLLGPEPSVLPLDHTPTNVREFYTREVQNTPSIAIYLNFTDLWSCFTMLGTEMVIPQESSGARVLRIDCLV